MCIKKSRFFYFIIMVLIINIILTKSIFYDSNIPLTNIYENNSNDSTIEIITWTDLEGFNELEQKYIDLYNSTYDNYKVKAVARPNDLDSDTITAMMSGSAPDILILSYDEVTTYAYMGLLLPLNDYFNSWEDFKNINPNIIDNFKINDNYYGLPCGEYTMSLLYNKKMFDEKNITIPKEWRWGDFIDIAKKFNDPKTGQYGFALNWNQWGNWWFQMFVWAAGGDLTKLESDGSLTTTFTDPAVIKAGEYYRRLKQEGCIQSNDDLRLDDLKKDFATGKAAMIFSGLDAISDFTKLGMSVDDIGVLPVPIGPGDVNPVQIGGSCYVMHKNISPEKRDAVFKFYELVSSKQYFEDKAIYYQTENIPFLEGQLRLDINYSELVNNAPDDMINMMINSSKLGRTSCYGSSIIAPFIDGAVQKIMTDTNSNIEDIFIQYENDANKQAVPQYNNNFK